MNKRVFNEAKTIELQDYDLTVGELKEDKLSIAHHEATTFSKAQVHYETVAEYENGGKDVCEIIDVPQVDAKEAYDEFEDIYVYVPFSAETLARLEINNLKSKLYETDYQAIKYAEGEMTEDEYLPTKVQRAAWRDDINALEQDVSNAMFKEEQ